MFLVLVVDLEHEVAFKRQSGEDDVPVLLRREKPLSRDASLLMVLARREHAFTDGHDEAVVLSRDAVAEFLGRYHDDSGTDEVRARRRVDAAIAALVARDLLTAEPDDPDLFVVSPAIVPLITVEQLVHLERVYLDAAGVTATGGGDAAAGPDADVVDPVEIEADGDAELGDSAAPESEPEPDPTAVPLDLDLDLDLDLASDAKANANAVPDADTDTEPEAPQA